MNDTFVVRDLYPVLPELVLAVGAMVLLMLGAFRGERAADIDQLACDPAAGRGRRRHRLAAGGAAGSLRRQLRARALCPLPQAAGADRLRGRDPDVARLPRARRPEPVRISDPDPALDRRHADADLGGRPDRALSRPRADEPGALRGRRDQPRLRALDRSRPEIFRARRAVVGDAALRRLAGLRLHRHRQLRRHRQGVDQRRHRPDLRAGVPVRRLLLQGLGGAVPHVDAGRLRRRADAGHGVLRRRAEGRRHRDVRARRHRRVPRHRAAMAADRGVRRRSPRWCSARSPRSASATSSG